VYSTSRARTRGLPSRAHASASSNANQRKLYGAISASSAAAAHDNRSAVTAIRLRRARHAAPPAAEDPACDQVGGFS
jgi:hypothetical protein